MGGFIIRDLGRFIRGAKEVLQRFEELRSSDLSFQGCLGFLFFQGLGAVPVGLWTRWELCGGLGRIVG